MIPYIEPHLVFYGFIGFIVGAGLFFSRSMDKDVHQYFWAGLSNGGGTIVFSVFLLILLHSLIIILPGLSLQTTDTVSVGIIGAAFIIPFLFGKKIVLAIGNFPHYNSRTTSVLLNILGLMFLCSVHILVLLQITDFVLAQFFGSTQYSIMVVLLVGAGLYTMAGGLNAVLRSNIITGSFVFISLLLIFLNALFFNLPLFFSFKSTLQFGGEIFRVSGIAEPSLMIAVIGIILMMLCMIWMGGSEIQNKVTPDTQNIFLRKIVTTGAVVFIMVCGILFLIATTEVDTPYFAATPVNLMNYFIAASFLGGLMGIFAITFHITGSIVAVQLYPYFKSAIEGEEQILVGRLSTVFVILLSIILISFAQVSGYKAFIWYINFVAFFFTPIIAAFLSTFAVKKGASVGFLFGIIAGELYAAIELIGQNIAVHSSIFQSASAYSFAVEIALISLLFGIVSGKASEMVVVEKILSRMKITRPTPL